MAGEQSIQLINALAFARGTSEPTNRGVWWIDESITGNIYDKVKYFNTDSGEWELVQRSALQILEDLRTVDGEGSGLDADTLQGYTPAQLMSGGGGSVPALSTGELLVGQGDTIGTAQTISGIATINTTGVLSYVNGSISHTGLSDIGTNTHAQIDAKLASIDNIEGNLTNIGTLGAGQDGQTLTWDNATSRFVMATPSGQNFANTDLTFTTGARTHNLNGNKLKFQTSNAELELGGSSVLDRYLLLGANTAADGSGYYAGWDGSNGALFAYFGANEGGTYANKTWIQAKLNGGPMIYLNNSTGSVDGHWFNVDNGSGTQGDAAKRRLLIDSTIVAAHNISNFIVDPNNTGTPAAIGSEVISLQDRTAVFGTDTLPTSTAFEVYDGDTTPRRIFDIRNDGGVKVGDVLTGVATNGYIETQGNASTNFFTAYQSNATATTQKAFVMGFDGSGVMHVAGNSRLVLTTDRTFGTSGSYIDLKTSGNRIDFGSNGRTCCVFDEDGDGFYEPSTGNTFTFGPATTTSNAILAVEATDRGFLLPRLTTVQRDAISTVAADNGLMIFNTTTSGINYYDGATWQGLSNTNFANTDLTVGAGREHTLTDTVRIKGGAFQLEGLNTLGTASAFEIYDGDTIPVQLWDFRNNGDIYSTLIDLVSTGEISIGSSALGFGTGISIGTNAGTAQTGAAINNTFIGKDSGLSTTTGQHNTALGKDSFRLGTSGTYNIAIGVDVMSNAAVTGNHNIGIGFSSMDDMTSGSENIGFGQYAGSNITTGTQNTCLGSFAGSTGLLTGSRNVFVGYSAGRRETGSDKFFVDNRTRTTEALARIESLLYGEMAAAISSQRLTVNGRGRLQPMSATDAAVLTASDGDMVYVNTTDATFTSVGFWGYENGAWVKL